MRLCHPYRYTLLLEMLPDRTCRHVIPREPITGCERFLDLGATAFQLS
jgi:hypothetical protein